MTAAMRFLTPELPPVAAVDRYYVRSRETAWFSNFGPCHELLVERLERYLGGGLRCVPVANCTLGLMLALRAAAGRHAPGRIVVVPSFTFAATVEAIVWAGFEPLFVDVDPDSWHLAPDALDAALSASETPAGVLACSTFGTAPPVAISEAWHALCADAGVPLVVDSAAGFGGLDERGVRLGGQGDIEIFSFHATKPFAIGEGGLVTTRHPDVAYTVRSLANFGLEGSVVSGEPGLNAKLAEWPAATALAVLDGFDEVLERRRAHAAALRFLLEPLDFRFQPGSELSAWQFVPTLAPSRSVRDQVLARAVRHGVELRRYFDPPLHRMPAFAEWPTIGDLKVTDELAARMLSLPMSNRQQPDDHATLRSCVDLTTPV